MTDTTTSYHAITLINIQVILVEYGRKRLQFSAQDNSSNGLVRKDACARTDKDACDKIDMDSRDTTDKSTTRYQREAT